MFGIPNAVLAVLGGFFGLAILSVIVSKNSAAPQLVASTANAISSVIKAAVNPVNTAATNANPAANPFSNPTNNGAGNLANVFAPDIGQSILQAI